MKADFQRKILDWYAENRRTLPWRKTKDPYKVWLSEVILQQTRIAQGLPYYQRFVQRFPTIDHLANAPMREVLRQWQGLGYYTRARNLRRCAKEVVRHHKGKFPREYVELLKLPGIGDYTAAAIASICFGRKTAVVDGNVYRLLARYYGLFNDVASPEGRRTFSALANQLIPVKEPGEFNQAAMEFGALQCVPRNPACGICPLRSGCVAHRRGIQNQLPVKAKKSTLQSRWFYYFVIESEGRVLLRQRPVGDIWAGLYEFPMEEAAMRLNPGTLFKKIFNGHPASACPTIAKPVRHMLSHRVLHLYFIQCKANRRLMLHAGKKFSSHPFTLRKVDSLPKPAPVARFMESLLAQRS